MRGAKSRPEKISQKEVCVVYSWLFLGDQFKVIEMGGIFYTMVRRGEGEEGFG